MVELSNERIDQILHRETVNKEDTDTILRSIYTRYMRLYEKYFADIEALNDDVIAELRKYHEETLSLIKYYYLDIPQDVCTALREFGRRYDAKLLGAGWHEVVFDSYEEFRDGNEEAGKEEFAAKNLDAFYDAMDYVFRPGFGTESRTAEKVISGISGLLFGEK